MSWLWKSNFIKRVLENVIKRAIGELNNIFQDEFNNSYLNSQRMSDSFFFSHKRIKRIKLKHKGPEQTHFTM